jgi:hypothetical protein
MVTAIKRVPFLSITSYVVARLDGTRCIGGFSEGVSTSSSRQGNRI